jgi:hypothetical protein
MNVSLILQKVEPTWLSIIYFMCIHYFLKIVMQLSHSSNGVWGPIISNANFFLLIKLLQLTVNKS